MQNSDFRPRFTSPYGSQTSPVVFCNQNSDFSTRIARLNGPSPYLWFCAFTTATLWPELIVSLGPRPHLCFFCIQNSDYSTRIANLYVSQPSSQGRRNRSGRSGGRRTNVHAEFTSWWRHVSTTWRYRDVNYTREAAAGFLSRWSLLMSVLRRFLQSSIHPRASCLLKIGLKNFHPRGAR